MLRNLVLMLVALSGIGSSASNQDMELSSPFFRSGGDIPGYFTCDGPNVAPALQWRMPEGGKSTVLVLEALQPEDGTSVIHWLVWDLPGERYELSQELKHEGKTDFETTSGYRGPCPDRQQSHAYRFTVVACSVSSLTGVSLLGSGFFLPTPPCICTLYYTHSFAAL